MTMTSTGVKLIPAYAPPEDGKPRNAVDEKWMKLTNSARHSDAKMLQVALQRRDGRLLLAMEDDGQLRGEPRAGNGLTGMRERVTALGGSLTISCMHGTRVSVSLPLRYV